jgi:N-dimethylarginine dimethylaminohydrolase
MIGTGNRTNAAAAKQISLVLKQVGVRTLIVKMPKGVQHLLGVMQIIDHKLVVARTERAPWIAKKLKALNFKIIPVRESAEITECLGMNFVTLRPRQIIMAAHCPALRRQLEEAGVRVLATLEISQLINAAGGIACATGILARKVLP